jgi:hypothetical protein
LLAGLGRGISLILKTVPAASCSPAQRPDELEEIFGKKEALWVPELHRTLMALCSLGS